MARNLCSNNAPRAELDYRARDARVRLVRIEQLLVARIGRRGFRRIRLFSWRFSRAPKLAQTRTAMNGQSGGAMPEIDSAWWFKGAAA